MTISTYQQLLADLAMETGRITALLASSLRCGPGCDSCCISFAVFPIEARNMQEAIVALPPAEKEKLRKKTGKSGDCCPLLLDKLCAIYEARPVICRTQGLPLAYVDEERESIEVSACPLNFGDDFAFSEENLLFMDAFNSRLFDLNLEYCVQNGLSTELRIPILDIATKALDSSR